MNCTKLKSAMVAFAVSLGALAAVPAFAACDLCTLAEAGDHSAISDLLAKRPPEYTGEDAQSISVNGQDNKGNTALLAAARYNQLEVVMLLLEDEIEPADPNIANKHGRTPLMWAAQKGNIHIVRELLQHGAELHTIGSKKNQSAFAFAQQKGNSVVGGELILRGATLQAFANTSEHLHGVVVSAEDESEDSFNRRLAEGIFTHGHLDFAIDGAHSPLFWAAANDDSELGLALLSDDADCNAINGDGQTASGVAHNAGNDSFRDMLIGANCAAPVCGEEMDWDGTAKQCVPICGDHQEIVGGECECVDGFSQVGKICIPGFSYCHEMGKILDQTSHQCKECDDGMQLHPDGENRCVPTVAHCNAMDKIRNADFMCESCGENEVRNGNSCVVCGENKEVVDGVCKCIGGFSQVGKICIPGFSYCHEMGKILDQTSHQCKECDDGMQLHPDGENRCIPTIAHCNEMDKIRNEDFVCVPCTNSEYREGNQCLPRCPSADMHWVNEEYGCVPVPPAVLAKSEPLSFLEAYRDAGGDFDAVVYDDYFYAAKLDMPFIVHMAEWFSKEQPSDWLAKLTLLADRADLTATGERDANVLHGLLSWGLDSSDGLRHVLNKNKDIVDAVYDFGDRTPLIMANDSTGAAHSDETKVILEFEPDVNYVSSRGTALYLAVEYRTTLEVQALIDAGADCNLPVPGTSHTPFTRARENNKHEILAVLEDENKGCAPEVQAAQVECPTELVATPQEDGTLAVEEVVVDCAPEYIPDTAPIPDPYPFPELR